MYITKANFKRIIREIDVPQDYKFEDLILWKAPDGKEYKGDWKSNKSNVFTAIFSQWEKNHLLAFKAFCKGDTSLLKYIYNRIEKPTDSLRYIRAEKSPVYHSDINCPAMKSDYERIAIPEQIIEQGRDAVLDFRRYWNEQSDLREKDMSAFVARVNLRFSLNPPILDCDFESTTIPNSGIQNIKDNRSVMEINDEITRIWMEFVNWIKEDRKKRLNICLEFGYLSGMGNSDKTIDRKLPNGLTEEELKRVLVVIETYKKQIYNQLQELYMRQYIPDLNVDDSLLKSLGFEPCYICAMHEGGL
ncbi:MAG: hypothetical protein PUB29_12120 [Bacteroidales bacterium]|nr:hypothetical protein [Bacteroidales bacterium]